MLGLRETLHQAYLAQQEHEAAMISFRACLLRHDRNGMETERAKACAALEVYLDHLMLADEARSA